MTSVSVIMPVLNVAPTIEAAMASVLAAPEVAELLVYDDGSTDGTAEILAAQPDPRVEVFRGVEGLRYPRTMNYLFDRASAPYVALCDGDDLYAPGRLPRQIAFLEGHPDYVAVSGAYASMTAEGAHVAPLADAGTAREVTEILQGGKPISHLATFLIRNAAMREVGSFRDWFENAFDLDLQFRLAHIGRIWHDPDMLAFHYRLHDASMTHKMSNARRQFFDRMVVEFARQRAETGEDDLMRGTPPTPPEPDADDAGAAPRSVRDQIVGHIEGAAWRALADGRRGAAIWGMMRCIAWQPLSALRWRRLAVLAAKAALPRR